MDIQLKRGLLDVCVLSAIRNEDSYGYKIIKDLKPVLELCKQVDVHAMAHITGGGLPGNVPRVLPDGLRATIDESSWTWSPLFKFLQEQDYK